MSANQKLSDSQLRNRESWTESAKFFVSPGERNWRRNTAVWGIWEIPESRLQLLPSRFNGLKCLEIGCGTAYVSAWMATLGAEVFAIDPTPEQLQTAQRLETEYERGIHLLEGFGEQLPFADQSIDFAISEYGAALWADPYEWVPEAARVLVAGGTLTLLTNHPLATLAVSDDGEQLTRTLNRPYLGLGSVRWPGELGEEFYLTHGAWIELFRQCGLKVRRLLEFGPPPDAVSTYVAWADSEWAQEWPTEEVWVVEKD